MSDKKKAADIPLLQPRYSAVSEREIKLAVPGTKETGKISGCRQCTRAGGTTETRYKFLMVSGLLDKRTSPIFGGESGRTAIP